jgi:3-oxoacyl-[acyl-carrier-protein] synthase II
MVAAGDADYCLAGASDALVVPLMLAGYHQMKALDPEQIRPFDQRRRGFQVGEGAGVVFMETRESALARGAKIYGEVLGYELAGDGHDAVHFDSRDDGLARALQRLMRRVDADPCDIDYLNLHGTGTYAGDLYETSQIKKAFGPKAGRIAMSSTKSMTGHMLGASGAAEVIACLLSMEEGRIPPTVGLEKADPACDLDYTPGRSRAGRVRTALSVSLGFGGHIALIALRKE